jgi:hypothetical protein
MTIKLSSKKKHNTDKKTTWYDKQSPSKQKTIDDRRESRDAKRTELIALGKRCESMLKELNENPSAPLLKLYLTHMNLSTKNIYTGKNPLYLLEAIAGEAFQAWSQSGNDTAEALEAALHQYPPSKPSIWIGAGQLKTQFNGYPKKGSKAAQICVYKPSTKEDTDKKEGEISSKELTARGFMKWDYVFNVTDCTFDGKEWSEIEAQ